MCMVQREREQKLFERNLERAHVGRDIAEAREVEAAEARAELEWFISGEAYAT